jgi:formamidopyrimidine-DNA glycosylase
MEHELIGKTIQSGEVVKRNSNMFMGSSEAIQYDCLTNGTVVGIESMPPNIYILLNNDWGILIRQSGGKILYNKTASDIPKNHNIIFHFTDGGSLTYTMNLFTLGIIAVSLGEWQSIKQLDTRFDPLGDSSLEGYMGFINADKDYLAKPVKLFLTNHMMGISSTFAAEILLHAGIYPSTRLNKLTADEHKRIYETMKRVLNTATEAGGRTSETDLYGVKGRYVAMAERKHIGEGCPVCGNTLEKNSTGGVTAFCPCCQVKK